MIRTLAAAVLATFALGAPAIADDHTSQIGPMVGSQAPSLSNVEAVGTETAFSTTGENGTVLVFFRSADWCPFCRTQLKELNAAVGPLSEAGWRLSALSYDSPQVLTDFATEHALDFALLSDPGSETIKAFGLLNEEMKPTSRAYGIPHPSVVFVRNDGTVAAVLREEGYKTRPSIDAIIEAATLLNDVPTGAEAS